MAIVQRTIVDQIKTAENGTLWIRFGLQTINTVTGKEAAPVAWHRTAVEPGGDVDAQMAAVNAHLAQMGKAPCPASEVARVKAVATVVHTPAVVKAYRDAVVAAEAKLRTEVT